MRKLFFLVLFSCNFLASSGQHTVSWSTNQRNEPTVKGVHFTAWLTQSFDSLWNERWHKLKVVDSVYVSFSAATSGAAGNVKVETGFSALIQNDLIQLFEDLELDSNSLAFREADTIFCEIITQSRDLVHGKLIYNFEDVDLPPQIGKEPYGKGLSASACMDVFVANMNTIASVFELPEKFVQQRSEGSFVFDVLFDDKGELALIVPVFASNDKALNDFAFLHTAQIAASKAALKEGNQVYMYYMFEFDLFCFDKNQVVSDKEMIRQFIEQGDYWNANSKYRKLEKMGETLDLKTLNALRSLYVEIDWMSEAAAITSEINRQVEIENEKPKPVIEVGEVKAFSADEENSKLPLFKQCANQPPDVSKSQCSAQVYADYVEAHLVIPEEFLKLGITSNVLCKIYIDLTGKVKSVEIVRSEHAMLNQAAIAFFKGLPPMAPYMKNGKPVEKAYLMNLRYTAE